MLDNTTNKELGLLNLKHILMFFTFTSFLLWLMAWFGRSFRIQHSYLVAKEQVFIFAKVFLENTCFALVRDLTKVTGLMIMTLFNKVWQLPIFTVPKYFVTRCVACFRKLECSLFLKLLKWHRSALSHICPELCTLPPPIQTHNPTWDTRTLWVPLQYKFLD